MIWESRSCRLSALVDPAPAAADFAQEAGVPIHTTLTDLFASQHLDGVMVATPNSLHVENGLDCAEHSVPGLVEKPISNSVEEAIRLAEAASAGPARADAPTVPPRGPTGIVAYALPRETAAAR